MKQKKPTDMIPCIKKEGPKMKANAGVLIAILVIVIILMALLMWGVLVIDWSKVLI